LRSCLINLNEIKKTKSRGFYVNNFILLKNYVYKLPKLIKLGP